jgi:hypothetical protein
MTPAEQERAQWRARLSDIWRRYAAGAIDPGQVRRELGHIWPDGPGLYDHEVWPNVITVHFDDPDTRTWRYEMQPDFRTRRTYIDVWFGRRPEPGDATTEGGMS